MFLRYFCRKYLPNVFHQLGDILHRISRTFFTKCFGNMNHKWGCSRRGVVVGPSGDAPTSMVPRGAVPVKERNQWGRRRSPHGEGCFWPQLHVLGNRNTRVRVQVPQERRRRATEIYVNDAAARYPRQSLFAAASCLPREGEPRHTEHTTFFLS
jgi:hypothetical protein